MHKVNAVAAAALATTVALVLAGCTSAGPLVVPAPSATRTSATRAEEPTGHDPAPVTTPTTAVAPPWNVAHDTGVGPSAAGTVTTDAHGVPIRYTVVNGDSAGAICRRLGVRWWQLKSDGTFLGTYPTLAVGEVIDIVDVAQPADVADDNALC